MQHLIQQEKTTNVIKARCHSVPAKLFARGPEWTNKKIQCAAYHSPACVKVNLLINVAIGSFGLRSLS